MALGVISVTEGSGDKLLATASIVQGGQTVELQRVVTENFGNAGPDTYASAVFPNTATSGGILLSIENNNDTTRALYLARLEIEQITASAGGTLVRFDLGRADENGTGGVLRTPIAMDPGVTTTGITLRISDSATPDTGIDGLASAAGDPIYASRAVYLGDTDATLARAVFDFSGMGQYPSVPLNSEEPIALEVSGDMDGADIAINVVVVEHEL